MKLAASSSVKPLYGERITGKGAMVSATITSSPRKKHAEEGTGSLSCPINKTPLPPYLTLYTRKILLNLVLDEYPRREKGVKGKKRKRGKEKMQRWVAGPALSREFRRESVDEGGKRQKKYNYGFEWLIELI